MWLRENRLETKAEAIYEVGQISRQGYFQAVADERQWDEYYLRLEETVRAVRVDHKRMGSRVMYYKLGIEAIGVNKFERLMSSLGMALEVKRKWIRTTDSRGGGPVYPNLTNGLKINNINQLIVGDITYFLNETGTFYISMLTDVYSMRIVGSIASDNMMATNNYRILKQMFRLRSQEQFSEMIHHTDKGSQYRSELYLRTLEKAGILVSMASTCIENPYAERINGIIKNDYLCHEHIKTLRDLQKELRKAVHKYNSERPQMHLGWKTPEAYEAYVRDMDHSQRPVKTLYDFERNDVTQKS